MLREKLRVYIMKFSMIKMASIAALVMVIAGCAGISVNTDYDTSRDFGTLKTYAWMTPAKKLIVDPLVDNDLMNKRVQRAVESELSALGYVKANSEEGADFFVTYHVSSEDKISVSSFHGHYGYYPCWRGCYGYGYGGYGSDIHVRQYKQGTFMIDVVDPASRELMWRGVAGKRLNTGTPEERNDYVRSIVTAIFTKFPPTLFGATAAN